MALFAWVTIRDINQPDNMFSVSVLAISLALTSAVIAAVSYFWAAEKHRTSTALGAYIVALAAVITLVVQTGETSSPFLALWMITAVFGGIFGMLVLGLLAGGIVGLFIFLMLVHQLNPYIIFTLLLAGLLPLLTSFILWHSKSNNEKTKERAYYDLANELDQVANKSDTVIGAISDGVIAINNKGQIELINPAAQRTVGWDHQDALGLDYKSVLQLLSADNHELDKATDPVFEVLTTNQPKRRNDLQIQTSSGKKIPAELIISPIGRIGSGAIIVFRDIAKEQAEEKAQAEFISTASHEMRTPVASIEGYLGLALNPATAKIDDKAREFITKAHESAQHLGRLFQDLLDVTKADDGRMQNNPKVIEVVSYTNDIVEGLRPKADEKKLRLFLNPATDDRGGERNVEPIFYVDLDADHLREVLANLVENAIKYTPAGEVVITIQGDEEHVVVSIKDSGIGIPAEDIPHLFQKFYRVDNTDTREIGGTGLGLYLCRRLVETMGGRIWVDSEYKKGSTFSVELPRISHMEAQRLIEARSKDSIQPSVTDVPLDAVKTSETDADDDTPVVEPISAQERETALNTPIILNRDRPAGPQAAVVTPAAPAAPATEQNVDPLVGNPQSAEAAEPLRPKNPMVLPSALQNMPSNLQTAKPRPQPVSQTAAPGQPVVKTATPQATQRPAPQAATARQVSPQPQKAPVAGTVPAGSTPPLATVQVAVQQPPVPKPVSSPAPQATPVQPPAAKPSVPPVAGPQPNPFAAPK